MYEFMFWGKIDVDYDMQVISKAVDVTTGILKREANSIMISQHPIIFQNLNVL